MPTRLLPQADVPYLDALEAAQRKLSSIPSGAPRIISPATEANLGRILPLYRSELAGRHDVVGQQTEATLSVDLKKEELRLFATHLHPKNSSMS